ncbi:Helix-turn-helix domain-containing protein OS=Streptomyces cyaneofuscatus OX=66883 GN=G3I52_16780 PE=4 SV=1 [Streptomyces cyaneofuscatus]
MRVCKLRDTRGCQPRTSWATKPGAAAGVWRWKLAANPQPCPLPTDQIFGLVGSPESFEREWREIKHGSLLAGFPEFLGLEHRAAIQPALVPGLLQTPEYMRAILSRYDDLSEETVRRTASARIERQEALYDASKTLQFVITEPVLRWLIVPARVMAGRLDRLVGVSPAERRMHGSARRERKYDVPTMHL